MAITYTQPNDIAFARSPILFGVYDSTFEDTGFYYTCDVYVWQGLEADKPATATYSLEKYPSPNGTATFNIQSLAKDYFIQPQYTHTSYADTQDMYCWISVDLNWVDDAGTGTPIVLDPIVCYNGYNEYLDGVNYVDPFKLGSINSGFFMTDRPLETNIPSNTSMYMYMTANSGGSVTGWTISVNGGADIITGTTTTAGGFTNELAAVPCGSSEVDALSSETLETWDVYTNDVGGNPVGKVYTFNLVEPCRFGFRNLQFMNRYGIWDNIIIYGTQIEKLDVERKEIFNSPLEVSTAAVMTTNDPYGQYHMSGISGRESLTVNTGWISEDYNEVLKQLMLTEHLFDPDTSQPFTIDTKSLTVKTSLNNGLSFYTFDLKQAHTAINSVY